MEQCCNWPFDGQEPNQHVWIKYLLFRSFPGRFKSAMSPASLKGKEIVLYFCHVKILNSAIWVWVIRYHAKKITKKALWKSRPLVNVESELKPILCVKLCTIYFKYWTWVNYLKDTIVVDWFIQQSVQWYVLTFSSSLSNILKTRKPP